MLYAENLFNYIANELGYTQSYFAKCIGISVATVSKWNKHTAIPSQEMYRTMLHFAKLMEVNCDDFTIELYVSRVLELIYADEFVQYQPIDFNTNTVFLQNVETNKKYKVKIEDLTNKRSKF